MMDVNSGYIGYSMSRRAAEAYEDGEKPRSKWTKKAMIAAIKDACDDLDLAYDPAIEKMKKAELFHTFLYNSSWHHTGKFFNETDFYAIECHQLHSTRGMPGNDHITLGGEAQAMRAASAEMADGEGKHDIGLETR